VADCLFEASGATEGGRIPSARELAAANINPATGLATDYLNHFNEITMLIGLVADMPEMIDEVRQWRPAGYEQHFERSGFTGRALAIAAYRTARPAVRRAFEEAIAAFDRAILALIARLEAAAPERYGEIAGEAETVLPPLMARASGIIHGVEVDTEILAADTGQAAVDVLFA